MLRRPATAIFLKNEDYTEFEARHRQRLAQAQIATQRRLQEQQQLKKDRARQGAQSGAQNTAGYGVSGLAQAAPRQENERLSQPLGATSKSNKTRGQQLDSSLLGFDQSEAGFPTSPTHRSPRRHLQFQEEPQPEDGMDVDLDAEVPDADVDLDADIPDHDATQEEPSEDDDDDETEEVTNPILDTSGLSVPVETPTAPARPTRSTATAPTGRPQHPQLYPPRTSSQPGTAHSTPAATSTTSTRAARMARRDQLQAQAAQHGRRPASGYDGAYDDDFAPPPPMHRLEHTYYEPRRRGSPHPAQFNHNHRPRDDADDDLDNDDDTAEHEAALGRESAVETPISLEQQAQEAEIQRRRRIMEETAMVQERERARRARIFGVNGPGRGGAVTGGRFAQGQMPPPPSYGGVPGAPARGATSRTGRR